MWPKLTRDHVGATVKTLRELQNGWCTIAIGTVATVTYSRAGLSLSTEPCKCCGVRVLISRVPYTDVELIAI